MHANEICIWLISEAVDVGSVSFNSCVICNADDPVGRKLNLINSKRFIFIDTNRKFLYLY